jgi:hypothetical protein
MPSYLYGIYKDAIVPNNAIMGDMNVRHEQAIFPDHGFKLVCRTAAYRHCFTYDSVVANNRLSFFARKF